MKVLDVVILTPNEVEIVVLEKRLKFNSGINEQLTAELEKKSESAFSFPPPGIVKKESKKMFTEEEVLDFLNGLREQHKRELEKLEFELKLANDKASRWWKLIPLAEQRKIAYANRKLIRGDTSKNKIQ